MSHEKWVKYFTEGKNCCQLPIFFSATHDRNVEFVP